MAVTEHGHDDGGGARRLTDARSSCDGSSARRAIHACPTCANCPSCQFVADSSLALSGKSPPHSRASRLAEEGRFAIVTSVELGRRWARCSAAGCQSPRRRTERCDGEVVWSWHRGADAKPAVMMIRRRRGQDSRSPGRAPITRSNRRAGKAGYWAEPVVLPRAFLLHADRGYQPIPGLPCASSSKERSNECKARAHAAARSPSHACCLKRGESFCRTMSHAASSASPSQSQLPDKRATICVEMCRSEINDALVCNL